MRSYRPVNRRTIRINHRCSLRNQNRQLFARTREAKLQIELAQSEYLLPRLLGMWKHLDRERGGIGVSRGTGEKQIEKDRQILRRKIGRLNFRVPCGRRILLLKKEPLLHVFLHRGV